MAVVVRGRGEKGSVETTPCLTSLSKEESDRGCFAV